MRTIRVTLLGIVMSTLVVGCGADPASPGAVTTSSPEQSAVSSPSETDAPTGTTGGARGRGSKGSDESVGSSSPTSSPDPTADSSPDSTEGKSSGDDSEAQGLEMPLAPEPSAASLTDLLPATNTSPLVRAPLPRAASAVGRIVPAFPELLRPPRASLVESSSISPAGVRLQVGLVASTALAPEEVMLAYRTRFTRRGLSEQAAPATAPGSLAAAFRHGPSTVTVTVTDEGSRTSYSIHATLHTGRG